MTAVALAACGGEEGPLELDGAKLFVQQNCIQCHGDRGQGTNLGPSLLEARAHWTREQIAEYLNDPDAFVKRDARLAELARKFTLPMTKFLGLAEVQRLALADHVLGLE